MDRGPGSCPRDKEAVFSSSEDRIRTSHSAVAVAGPVVASHEAWSSARVYARRAAESLFSVLFPSDCRICGLPLLNISRLPVCPDCLARIHPVEGNVCSICGERVLSAYADADDDGLRRCPACRRLDRPYERAVAYGSYDGGLRDLIHLLKYNGVRPAARVLGRMLAETWPMLESSFAGETVLVVPVPLYKGKRRQRGFNQSELIAGAALKLYSANGRLQLAPGLLLRARDTHSQIGLTSHQRRENLRGAFAVARAEEVTGREVLLVDDVYTTGTTVSECSKVLRRAGAARVWVATVARTLKLASKYVDIAAGSDIRVSEFQRFKVGPDRRKL
jgi:ComF family protein